MKKSCVSPPIPKGTEGIELFSAFSPFSAPAISGDSPPGRACGWTSGFQSPWPIGGWGVTLAHRAREWNSHLHTPCPSSNREAPLSSGTWEQTSDNSIPQPVPRRLWGGRIFWVAHKWSRPEANCRGFINYIDIWTRAHTNELNLTGWLLAQIEDLTRNQNLATEMSRIWSQITCHMKTREVTSHLGNYNQQMPTLRSHGCWNCQIRILKPPS